MSTYFENPELGFRDRSKINARIFRKDSQHENCHIEFCSKTQYDIQKENDISIKYQRVSLQCYSKILNINILNKNVVMQWERKLHAMLFQRNDLLQDWNDH